MVGTQVCLNETLGETVHLCATLEAAIALGPMDVFRRSEMLILDNVPWRADMGVIRSGLHGRRRKFKEPFQDEPTDLEVEAEIRKMVAQADELFAELFPDFDDVEHLNEWDFRPMITGPEPLHYDSRPHIPELSLVTAFINVSDVPRIYGVGPSLPQIVSWDPHRMASITRDARRLYNGDVSMPLRKLTAKGMGPLGAEAPKHRLELAPGSMWIFNAKTVSHEIVYGEGAIRRAWMVHKCGIPQQPDILANGKAS